MTQTAITPSPFESVSFYEKPDLLFSMLLDGEVTVKGSLAAVFDPTKTTLAERDTIRTRMKQAAGGNPVTNALIDIGTNPFVWLMFMGAPGAQSALSRGARYIFDEAGAYGAFVKKGRGLLSYAGLLAPTTELSGTPITRIFEDAMSAADNLTREERLVTGEVWQKALEKMPWQGSSKTLDVRRIRNPQDREMVSGVLMNLQATIEGWDQAKTTVYPVIQRNAEGVFTGVELVNRERGALINYDPRAVLKKYLGDVADPLVSAIQKSLEQRKVRLFGDEALYASEGVFKVDSRKLKNLHEGLKSKLFSDGRYRMTGGDTPLDVARTIFGPEMLGLMDDGAVSVEQFAEIASKTFVDQGSSYFPRAYMETVDATGTIRPFEDARRSATARIVTTSPNILARARDVGLYHPDDWTAFATFAEKNVGSGALTEEFLGEVRKSQEALTSSSGRGVTFLRMNPYESLKTYFDRTARTYGWFVAPVGKDVGELQRTTYKVATASGEVLVDGSDIKTIMHPEVEGYKAPTDGRKGYFNNSDALWASWSMLPQQYHRDIVVDLLLPASFGRTSVRYGLTQAMVINNRGMLKRVGESGMANWMETNGGSVGKRMVDEIRYLADENMPVRGGRAITQGIASHLYGTHLGFNPASILLNLTQPLLHGTSWLGFDNVLEGYQKAFQDMSKYAQLRSAKGGVIRGISAAERQAVMESAFGRFMNYGGEDLLQFGANPHEVLDQIAATGSGGFERPGIFGQIGDLSMKGFEKAEWFNRLVVAHATEAALTKAGVVDQAVAKQSIKRMIQETQFGSSLMNTPVAFQSDIPNLTPTWTRWLSNPLARQFLSFSTRSASAFLAVSPQIGGGVRNVLGQEVNFGGFAGVVDFTRMAGLSAIVYELGKNLAGVDLERGLGVSAATDVVGQRFSGDNGPIPIPPALDIVYKAARGVLEQDRAMLADAASRGLLPGGVALSKALGGAPALPSWLSVPLGQKTFADWQARDEQGRVPVFAADGSLVDYRDPKDIVMRSFGVDMAAYQKPGQLDRYLTAQRDLIVGARRNYINAVLANDQDKADAIASEFQRRHKMPLLVGKDQFLAAMRNRNTPRAERILDRIPEEYRPLYAAMVERSAMNNLNLRDPAQLVSVQKAANRDRTSQPQLTPEMAQFIREKMQESGRAQPFESFQPF